MEHKTHYIKLPKYKDKYIKLWYVEYGQCNNKNCRIHGIIRLSHVRESIFKNNYHRGHRRDVLNVGQTSLDSCCFYYKKYGTKADTYTMYYKKRKHLIEAEAALAQYEKRDLKLSKERRWPWRRIKRLFWRIFP